MSPPPSPCQARLNDCCVTPVRSERVPGRLSPCPWQAARPTRPAYPILSALRHPEGLNTWLDRCLLTALTRGRAWMSVLIRTASILIPGISYPTHRGTASLENVLTDIKAFAVCYPRRQRPAHRHNGRLVKARRMPPDRPWHARARAGPAPSACAWDLPTLPWPAALVAAPGRLGDANDVALTGLYAVWPRHGPKRGSGARAGLHTAWCSNGRAGAPYWPCRRTRDLPLPGCTTASTRRCWLGCVGWMTPALRAHRP